MSEADDALREMAANRGCKLVKSRRRKPGGDFGRYGLKDAKTGKELLGFGPDGLTATAEEIEAFLRGGAAASWKSSLRSAAARPAPPVRKAARAAKTAVAAGPQVGAGGQDAAGAAHRPEPRRQRRRRRRPASRSRPGRRRSAKRARRCRGDRRASSSSSATT